MSTENKNEPLAEFVTPTITLGAWLIQARQASGLTVQDISLRTNRSVQQLTDLEADNYNSFSSHALFRGIVRQYAGTVGADEAQALALIPEQYKPNNNLAWVGVTDTQSLPKKNSSMTSTGVPRVWFVVLAVLVLGLLAYWIFGARMFKSNEGAQKISAPNQVQVVNPPVAAPTVAAPVTPATTPAVTPVASTPVPADPNAAAIASGEAVLGLKINAPVWLEVKDAKGAVLLSGIQQASDAEQALRGELPLRVKIADGTKVQMSWKGQPYDLVPVMKNHGTVAKIERLE